MNVKPRYGAAIDLIVIHDPEGARTARELYNYLQRISAGYHAMVDDGELIVAATDDKVVEGAGGVNTRSLHICFIGFARWSREEWLQHMPMLRLGAQWIATKGQAHGIPIRHLTHGQVATPGTKGVCTHGDVSAAGYTASQGHYDPGAGFPMDVLLDLVRGDAQPEEEEDVPNLIRAPGWQTTNPNRVAAVELIAKEKRVSLINHARIKEATTIPSNTPIISWYETFNTDGSKKGFDVLARSGPGLNGNPTFHFTWSKKP